MTTSERAVRKASRERLLRDFALAARIVARLNEPMGPFATREEALADARESCEPTDADEFPEDTATVWDPRGFPHVGHLTEQRDEADGTALYYFPGDFIAGDGTEAWLDPVTATDADMLAEYLSYEDEQWTAEPRRNDDAE